MYQGNFRFGNDFAGWIDRLGRWWVPYSYRAVNTL